MIAQSSPQFALSEEGGPQLQTLHTLSSLGWRYVTRVEAGAQRRDRLGTTILEDVARERLAALNRICQRGREYPVPDAAVTEALGRLRASAADQSAGFMEATRRCTDLLRLGTSIDVTIEGETRGRQLRYVDWDEPANNRYHVAAEFEVERMGRGAGKHRRPDLVLFINGVPFAVVELKRSIEGTRQGISQTVRNQGQDEIPQLFATAQLVIAGNPTAPRYATAGTPAEFWAVWREDRDSPDAIRSEDVVRAVNAPLEGREHEAIFTDFARHRRRHDGLVREHARYATSLDEMLVRLLTPARTIELARSYVLYDAGIKKIARYQQYFGVRATLTRVDERDDSSRRRGGVIWHTQGSGKSLTMVMLAGELARTVGDPRIVLVTDRTDLDEQIRNTFKAVFGEEAVRQATTGRELLRCVRDRVGLVSTTIHKFRSGLNAREFADFRDEDDDVFLLVDESHRSQNVKDTESMHAKMRRVFPNAAYIGFTGTPLLKRERSTFDRFGALIHAYRIDDAVTDGAVVPLTYEGRHVDMGVDESALDRWFERTTKGLSGEQIAELKRRFARGRAVRGAEPWLKEVAFDVSEDFERNWKGTPYKAQLVAPDKRAAVLIKRLLDEFGTVTSEVIVSDIDEREGHDALNRPPAEEVVAYLDEIKATFGSVKEHERAMIEKFKKASEPEILIVVDKLLTGFDAPRNRVLYLAKPMQGHGLLQAIARVNRLYQHEDAENGELHEKPFGHVIDYAGVLGELDEALTAYTAFDGYDEGDVREALVSIRRETDKLPDRHAALLALFAGVANVYDQEAYERHLADELTRRDFYKRLREYAATLATAFSSEEFRDGTDERQLSNYKADLTRFENLRRSVARRYADGLDEAEHRAYDAKVRKLLDRHVEASGVEQLVAPVNIFDEETFKQAVEDETGSTASVADAIASATKKTVTERMDEDPVLYERFAKMIQDVIDAFRAGRLAERDYLARVRSVRDEVVGETVGEASPLPDRIMQDPLAAALFRTSGELLSEMEGATDEARAQVASALAGIARKHRRVGWQSDPDVENAMRNDMDDYLYDVARDDLGLTGLTPTTMDDIMDRALRIARRQLAS